MNSEMAYARRRPGENGIEMYANVKRTCRAFNKLNFRGHVAGTRRCNISLKHVPATFSCVCKCYDFVPATCPRYTTLMHVASVCTTHLFVAATCPCNMPRVCPPE